MNLPNITTLVLLLAGLFLQSCANSEPEGLTGPYVVAGKFFQPQDSAQVILSLFDPVTQEKTALDTADISPEGGYQLQFEFAGPDLFRVDFPNRQYVMLAIAGGQNQILQHLQGF